jgi:aldose 1-epimerase
MPWPNRIAGGRYATGGEPQQLALTEPDRGNALHGLVEWVSWGLERREAGAVTLRHRLHPQPGYPFTLDLAAGYELTAGGLAVTLRATNAGPAAAPFGTGLHPYLSLTGAPVDDQALELPARSYLPVDARLVPTGEPVPVDGTEIDLRRARPLEGLRLDTCFADLARDSDGLAHVHLATAGGDRRLTVWMDERFDHVQVFTNDADPEPERRRRSVAIEPMTCAPDAFNSGTGLVVLEPGETFVGRCGLIAAGF